LKRITHSKSNYTRPSSKIIDQKVKGEKKSQKWGYPIKQCLCSPRKRRGRKRVHITQLIIRESSVSQRSKKTHPTAVRNSKRRADFQADFLHL
jgi:hypothetical protein